MPKSRGDANRAVAHAGLRRTRAGLEALLDDPYPLARLIAVCAIAREETRVPTCARPPADRSRARPMHTIVEPDGRCTSSAGSA